MLIERLASNAQIAPDRIAWRFHPNGASLTFAEVYDRSLAVAGQLRASGVAPGTVVLIFAPQAMAALELFVGAMMLGAVPAFMPLPSDRQDPRHFWASHASLFRHIGEGAIFAPAALLPTLQAACTGNPLIVASLESLAEGGGSPLGAPAARGGDAVAFLQHSSGTTDRKKGVKLTFAQVEAQIASYARALALTEADRIVSWLPLYHDMGLIACFILPLGLGLETTFLDPFRWVARPHSLFDAIEARSGTHVWLPNFAFNHLARVVGPTVRTWKLGTVKAFINCSEPCKPASFDAFETAFRASGVHGGMLGCCYAMAETVFAITQTPRGKPVNRVRAAGESAIGSRALPLDRSAAGRELLSCGPPIDGVEVRIVDGAGAVVPDGVCGEIEVRGDFVFAGYNRDPERTAQAFDGEWFRTRDLGFLWKGELYVDGRIDDLIILSGRNFYAHHLEACVSATDGVIPGRAVVFGVYDEGVGSQTLVVVAETAIDPAETDRIASLTAAVSESIFRDFNLVPADVVLVPARTIVKTTSGKVDRQTNRKRYLAGELRTWRETATIGGE